MIQSIQDWSSQKMDGHVEDLTLKKQKELTICKIDKKKLHTFKYIVISRSIQTKLKFSFFIKNVRGQPTTH